MTWNPDPSTNERELEGHLRRNAALEAEFRKRGADFDSLRELEVHFWAPNRRTAALLGRELYRKDFLVIALGPSAGRGTEVWNVEAQKEGSIREGLSEEFTRSLIELASSSSSTYDGWGTSI